MGAFMARVAENTISERAERFCQDVCSGMLKQEAFRRNFEAKHPKAIERNARALAAKPLIKKRIAEIRQELSDLKMWERAKSVAVLASIAEKKDSNNMEKIRAVQELNRMYGYHEAQKIDHTSSDGTMSPKAGIDFTKLSNDALAQLLNAAT